MSISSGSLLHGKIMDWSRSMREVEYAGGMVFEPGLGVYKDVIIVDFSSKYSTIIEDGRISTECVTVLDEFS